jgi:ATP-dependent DNA helicase RecG
VTARVDLVELARRENEQTEWKENVANVDDVVGTLCAFANDLQNLGGGYVVCGAREDKDEQGFPRLVRSGLTAARLREVEGTVLARCRDRVSPPITPLVDELDTDDVERRILVFIQPATGAAHTFRRGDAGAKHFVRVGRSTIEARNGVLRDLLVRKGALEPWDRRPCNAATVADLDLLALRDALERMGVFTPDRGVDPYLVEGVQISPFVPSLCVAEPLSGVVRPRHSAILLFGREPQRFIPGAFSIYSAYPGIDRTNPVARRFEIAGTLLDQARRLRELLDAEAVTLFDKNNLKAPNAEKYPRRALEEAMVNALAHRDYELVDPARFTSYRDRAEFISPGSLPVGVTLEHLRTGAVTPRWRNQALAWFLSRLQLAQAEGQGIQTIRSTMKAAGCPPPIFDATDVSVTCVLRAHPRFESPKGESAAPGRRARDKARKATAKKKSGPRRAKTGKATKKTVKKKPAARGARSKVQKKKAPRG